MEEAGGDLPGGTVTFFFSDVEGSTRLASALGDRFAEVLEGHRRVVRVALAEFRGVEVSTAGDSFFAVFPSAIDGVAAAVAIEARLRGPGHGGAAEPIKVRMGLHTGQAVRVGRDYVGLDVHLAARVSDAGHGGQILVSEATRAAIGDHAPAGCTLTDLGRHRLKDVGPQRLWQLDGPGLQPGRFRPLRSLEAHPSNLPGAATPLIDRERERDELVELVERSAIVTVTGAGGIGKSRVAVEVARSMVDEFPDGVFFLDLLGSPDVAAVAEALLELIGGRLTPEVEGRAALLDRLRSRDLLLVLDTADRVTGLPGLVAAIAATCPRIRVLLTSRSPLHVAAEREYALLPLAPGPAIELFNARAQATRPEPPLDAEAAKAVERLVARLDGIPLAIELAAARTRMFTPAALLDRLERRLPSLGQGPRDLPDRQRTLQETIDWSCELLGPAEQAAFRELGVFAGSFDLEAMEAVVQPPADDDSIALLEALVDRSLVVAEHAADGERRFRLLRPIREFALDALRVTGDEDAVRERHARHWIAFVAARLDVRGQPGLDMIQAIEVNEADLRAALEWLMAGDAARADLGLDLAGSLGRYWWLRGRVHEGLAWLERGLSARPESSSAQNHVPALFWAGVLLDDAGCAPEAAARLEACLATQRREGDEVGIARTLNSLGVVARSMGDLDRAQALLEESIKRKRALDDRSGIPVSLSNLGVVESDRGRYDEAVRYMTEALEIDRDFGGGAEILSRANLGASLIRAGRFDEGLAQIDLALPGIEGFRDPELVTECLTSLAWAELASADNSAAPDHAGTRRAARLLFASEAVRAREGFPLKPTERGEVDELLARISARLHDGDLAQLRAEAAAIDLDAGLALVRDALGDLGAAAG